MRVARRYLITGRVHGVGFRFFTQTAAAREGIHGWVRNLTDGLVEAVEAAAEGESEAMERFERSIRQGPRGARVDRVEVEVTVPDGRALGFTIK